MKILFFNNSVLVRRAPICCRYLIAVALLAAVFKTQGQISITSGLVTSGDTVMFRGIDNYPDSNIAPGGAGLSTWNFTSLLNEELDTLRFVSPAATPYAWKFPTADFCLYNRDGFTYFRKSASKLSLVGSVLDFIGNGTLLPVKAKPEFTYIPFPSTYLTAYEDSTGFSEVLTADDVNAANFDSIYIAGTLETSVLFDAYGAMITPLDTMNVIRQRVTQILNYTVIGKKFLAGQVLYTTLLSDESSTETKYLWWSDSAGVKYPVVEMNVSPAGIVRSVQFAVALNVRVGNGLITQCHDSCDVQAAVLGADPSFTYLWSDSLAQTGNTAVGLCPGKAQVLVSDSNGAFVRIPFYVSNAKEITAAVAGYGASCTTCDDGVAFIEISGGSAPYTVLWDSSAGFQPSQVASGLLPGVYTVSVHDDHGCPAWFEVYVGLFKGIKVYPNPADDLLTVFTRIDGQMTLDLFDLAGRRVRSFSFSNSQSEFGVASLPEGHYIYRLADLTGAVLKTGHFAIIHH